MKFAVVTPWHNPEQKGQFLKEWGVRSIPDWLFLQQDENHEGCARTKNKGIRRAIDAGAKVVVVLDDDCFPEEKGMPLSLFAECHVEALKPQPVASFLAITDPPSRGTPYLNRTIQRQIVASMGFWSGVPDYDAIGQLRNGDAPPRFNQQAIFGVYFPLCGMNLAFRAEEWPWCQFVNVPRYDDVWAGFIWQRSAYARGLAFNLAGPTVRHSRQSNVFKNLAVETLHLERNETLWRDIAQGPLLPHPNMLERYGLTV